VNFGEGNQPTTEKIKKTI